MKEPKTYEEGFKELEEIVGKLESGDAGLDESMQLFEAGAKISAFCYKELEHAEQKIIALSKLTEAHTEETND